MINIIYYATRNRKALKYKKQVSTWDEFVEKLKSPVITDETYEEYKALTKSQQDQLKDCGGYVLGELKNGVRQTHTLINRCAVTLDIDYAESSFNWKNVVEKFNYSLVMHSTRNHTLDNPRYRLIIPTNRVVNSFEYNALARLLAGEVGIHRFDGTTFQAERMMYYPSVSSDSTYIFEVQNGPILDVDAFFAKYKDWKDENTLPKTEQCLSRQKHSKEMKRAGNPLDKMGAIGVFCRAYDIHEAIENFLLDKYTHAHGDRYTFTGGSTAAGAITYDNVFLYSHHNTDPCGSMLCNAFDLVRIHLFGDIDDKEDEKKDVTKRPSYAEMLKLVDKDVCCVEQLKIDVMAVCMEDFGDEADTDVIEKTERSKQLDIDIADAFFGKHGFNPVKLAKCIDATTPVKSVDGVLYVYDKGVYKPDNERIIKRYTAALLGERYRASHGNEVVEILKDLNTISSLELDRPSRDKINLRNGLFDLESMQLHPHSKEFISFAQIPVEYNPDAECPIIDKFIRDVIPADSVNMIYELFGLSLIPLPFSVAFFFLGEGKNGKSTMIDLLTAFIGEDNVSNVTLQDLSNNRFKLAQLQHKLVNAYGDLPSSMLSETDVFKSLCTGDKLNAERKGIDAFNFRPYARLVYGMNKMPKTLDFSKGFTRRLKIIEFNKPVQNVDVHLLEKMTVESELAGLLNKALEGLKRLLERGEFEINESTTNALKEYVSNNDPLESFIEECCILGEDLNEDGKILLNRFLVYLHENNFRYTPNRNQFNADMKSKGYEFKRVYDKETKKTTPNKRFVGLALKDLNYNYSNEYDGLLD